MRDIVFICPYFGKLPLEQTKLFLKCCSFNKNIDWLLITDDHTDFDYPDNVRVIYTSLSNLKDEISPLFDFDIYLDNAYKLCDFKPTYGYIFSKYISNYKYWGHCDISDCIFGDLDKFINIKKFSKYDKIGFWGHMTLYRNTNEVNKRIFEKTSSNYELKDILGSSNNMAFDEIFDYSINTLYLEKKYSMLRVDDIYYDASPKYFTFKHSKWSDSFKFIGFDKETCIFEWNNGSLFKISLDSGRIVKKEIAYLHYQKRKMFFDIDILNDNLFYIIPNKFMKLDSLNKDFIIANTKEPIINVDYLKIKYNRLLNKLKRKCNNIWKKK